MEEYAATVNQLDSHGFTPLHYACRRPAIAIVKYLVEAGADVNAIAQNKGADSPLCAATQGGDLEVVHFLISKGALINYRNGMKLNPLHLAIKSGKKLVSVYLIHNGADIELTDSENHTALHWAAYRGQFKILEVLLKAGSNVLASDSNGMLPLHWAAVHSHLDCIETLYEAEPAALDIQTKDGLLPVDMAKKYDKTEAFELLSSYKNSPSSSTSSSRKHKSYSISDFIYDVSAPSTRPFLSASVIVLLLLYSLAYFNWPNNLYSCVIILISYSIFVVTFCKERNSTMMGIGLWSHFYTNIIYFSRILPSK